MKRKQWYKDMTFYQIWPRSFKDGNGDGIGDLWGIYEKLDYIRSLGVDGIWFSPLYPSPNADYGYDIADYYNINPEYGDMDIFQKVLDRAHELGMKVIMDLVVNHTSDEHPWFLAAKKDKNSPYHDYYIWREGKRDKDGVSHPEDAKKNPNNWDSLFEGKAWEYVEEVDEYYLHIFAKKQPDLNHDNPAVREEVKKIMRFWLEKGVDGFREDVITFISKEEGLPNDYVMPAAKGLGYYSNGPHLHEYLQEYRRVAEEYDCFLLGEAPQMTPKKALPFIGEGKEQDLDMMFHFQHMEADCLMTDYLQLPFNLRKMKRAFSSWQNSLEGKGWNALYIENHDHPRIISRYGDEQYRVESGKMLAVMYLLQKGTAFVYQGQEIGMTNISLPNLEDYKDIQVKQNYNTWKGLFGEKKAMKLARKSCRDSARTPVQWNAGEHAGFTTGTPWFVINENYPQVNVESQLDDEDSLLSFYRKVIAYRKNPVIRYGTYWEMEKNHRNLYVYERSYKGKKVLVVCSFTKKPVRYPLPEGWQSPNVSKVLGNYEGREEVLRPYEVAVYEKA